MEIDDENEKIEEINDKKENEEMEEEEKNEELKMEENLKEEKKEEEKNEENKKEEENILNNSLIQNQLNISQTHRFSYNQIRSNTSQILNQQSNEIKEETEEKFHPFKGLEKAFQKIRVAGINYKNGLSYLLRKEMESKK